MGNSIDSLKLHRFSGLKISRDHGAKVNLHTLLRLFEKSFQINIYTLKFRG